MMLVEETSVPSAALPLDAFKAHLRMGTGFGEETLQDAVLESFLRAALAQIEARTGKILLSREFTWTLRAWRDPEGQPLPVAPVTSVIDVIRLEADGTEHPLALSDWRLERDHHRPVLAPVRGLLPAAPRGGEIAVGFIAGFAATFGDLPADLAQAVLMLAAHYYQNRGDTQADVQALPYGVSVLIERYRVVRVLGAGSRA
ncbi:MAG: head-tail connector protein [Shimia sp.]